MKEKLAVFSADGPRMNVVKVKLTMYFTEDAMFMIEQLNGILIILEEAAGAKIKSVISKNTTCTTKTPKTELSELLSNSTTDSKENSSRNGNEFCTFTAF